MSINRLKVFAVSAALSLAGLGSQAAVVVLDFEGIGPYPNNNDIFVEDFYNGGTSSAGTSGTNYGVEFSDNSLMVCLNTPGTFCSNASRGGQGDPNSAQSALYFLTGAASIMNVAAGFETGFSFFYSAINQTGSVSVYDGLDGTGTLLASLALPTTPSTCDNSSYGALFCPFQATGVAFGGTARSVSFAGVENQIGFDDITFGSATPGPIVPLPASGILLIGAIGGLVLRRRLTT